jgi:hypothetical protein
VARVLVLLANDPLHAEQAERHAGSVRCDRQRHVRQEALILLVDRAETRTTGRAAERALRRVVHRVRDRRRLHARDRPLHVRLEERLEADALVREVAIEGLEHGPVHHRGRQAGRRLLSEPIRDLLRPPVAAGVAQLNPLELLGNDRPPPPIPLCHPAGRSRSAAGVQMCGIVSPAARGP